MNESQNCMIKKSWDTNPAGVGVRCGWVAVILPIALFGTAMFATSMLGVTAQAQQSGSLADAARQTRAQKQAQPQADFNPAQQVADQLSEDQNENDAPGGFKTYNAGDYKLWVPAPYTVEGHDDAGAVLSGPAVGSKHSLVLVGTPIVSKWGDSDEAFHDAATQFAHLYAQSATCTRITVGTHSAYQCTLAAATLLGQRVTGNAIFVRGADNIYPVFCVAPTDSRARDMLNDPHSTSGQKMYARQTLDREEQDVKGVWQKCDSVFQSVRAKEGAVQQKAGANASADRTQAPTAGGPASLADIARRLKQDPGQAVAVAPASTSTDVASGSTVPAGFKVHAFQYCAAVHQCWDASVLVPADAKLISSDCRQYVFETKVQGSPFLLMAGPQGGECDGATANDASLVRWKELVDPENRRAPGTYTTISAQTRKLDGKAASVITLGFRKGLTQWMGKRAEVENNGIPVVVGCMAPRDYFADGDAVCSALIESLRLP